MCGDSNYICCEYFPPCSLFSLITQDLVYTSKDFIILVAINEYLIFCSLQTVKGEVRNKAFIMKT
jgi:hypothetical protein